MYDLVIVGEGFAGLSAAIYAARFRLNTLVIGKGVGGTLMVAHKVENYPGFKSISGFDLMQKLIEQVKSYDVEIKDGNVIRVKKEGEKFVVETEKEGFECKSVILATGTVRRKLNIPGEKEFENKGVHYCATCDGPLYKNKVVAVIGGSDSAAKEALFLAEHASKVYIIYRKEKIRAEPMNAEEVERNKKIEIITKTNVKEIKGKEKVESVLLDTEKEMKLDAVFIEIGSVPGTILAAKLGIGLNERKEVITDKQARTSVGGVFAAGDLTDAGWKQAVVAAAEGAMAAFSAFNYVKGKK